MARLRMAVVGVGHLGKGHARILAGLPEVKWGRVDEFFDRLNKVRGKLPSWQGELYLEYHRGVLTTHSELKAKFRGCERALQTWEAARCATGTRDIPPPPAPPTSR